MQIMLTTHSKPIMFALLGCALTAAPGMAQRRARVPVAPTPKMAKTQAAETASYVPGIVRVKDIADVQGVRSNQLVGYGLVVGLEGTGDGQTSLFTGQSVLSLLKRYGVTLNLTPSQLQVKNVAAVLVTADLPAFAKPGSKIDVTVSSLGDAKSLQGGLLIQTPLRAANNEIYAVAQGSVSIGGFNFSSGGSSAQKNFVNVGRIPKGASVEQEVPTTLTEGGIVQIALREPDFTTASRVAEAIKHQGYTTQALDAATVSVVVPKDRIGNVVSFLADLEAVNVTPDVQARIVINERTGTIVVGGNVRLSPGAVAHGSISIRIDNTPVIIPPAPFNNSPGVVVPLQSVTVKETNAQFAPIPATSTINQLVATLDRLGVTTRDLIAILQAMQRGGLINAQIEVI